MAQHCSKDFGQACLGKPHFLLYTVNKLPSVLLSPLDISIPPSSLFPSLSLFSFHSSSSPFLSPFLLLSSTCFPLYFLFTFSLLPSIPFLCNFLSSTLLPFPSFSPLLLSISLSFLSSILHLLPYLLNLLLYLCSVHLFPFLPTSPFFLPSSLLRPILYSLSSPFLPTLPYHSPSSLQMLYHFWRWPSSRPMHEKTCPVSTQLRTRYLQSQKYANT